MAGLKAGLKNSLNQIREISSEIYTRYVPIIDDDTNIATLAEPILTIPQVQNEFLNHLINKIVYTKLMVKNFKNPLKFLEGDTIPVGYAGEEIYTNPVTGRQFNVNDFAGLLQKYEADVKVQYTVVNSDLQYPVSVERHKLKQAFTSWETLEAFIDSITTALYNGAYIDEYRFTKMLVPTAYMNNAVRVEVVESPDTDAKAKAFTKAARNLFLNFQSPSSKYNGWALVGGYGRPITTWTSPEDIVFIIRNDVRVNLDVDVLANAFNMDKTTLLGNIVTVDNFDVYSETGTKIFDGSKIFGIIGDKAWFRIKTQDMYMDEFYNANNRVWNYYLNVTKMYQYSLFANAVVFASEAPNYPITNLSFNSSDIDVHVNGAQSLEIEATPVNGTTDVKFTSNNANIKVEKIDNRNVKVTGVTEGDSVLTAKAGNVSATLNVHVKPAQ